MGEGKKQCLSGSKSGRQQLQFKICHLQGAYWSDLENSSKIIYRGTDCQEPKKRRLSNEKGIFGIIEFHTILESYDWRLRICVNANRV